MTLSPVTNPFAIILNQEGGGLNGGQVYIGLANQDPQTFPQQVYWDAAGTIPAAQPLVTMGGYIWRAGTPAEAFPTNATYSIRVLDRFGEQIFYNKNVSNPLADFIAELATTSGGGLIGYDPDATYPVRTLGYVEKYSRALTPADFAHVVTGGLSASNHTPIFVALANAYNEGRAVHIPDLGFPYIIDSDTIIFTPPTSYNNTNQTPPALTMDKSAVIRAREGGAFLLQLGTDASDYSGYLRNADFSLGVIDGYNYPFTDGVLSVPFYRELRLDVTIKNVNKRGLYSGALSAPGPSAGLKGKRTYERDLELWRRDAVTIGNGVNPTVTFAAPHGLWPSSGRRCMAINFFGSPSGWNAITARSLDVLITSSTTVQLLNVDSTGYGSFAGTGACYLNMESMRVPKAISGVTNANPCVVTTATPHLFTSGDTVDLAEIGGMFPDPYRGAGTYTGLQGQYTVTVLSSTTFSIPVNTTSTSVYGAYSSGSGVGWAMQWVAPENCDIGEFHENATDVDDSDVYSFHMRIHQYHNPAIGGYDGKHGAAHFYNFPEAGEALCHYLAGGDNHFYAIQSDGPWRYVLMLYGPNNTASGCKTNCGYIEPRAGGYGAFARGMDASASLEAEQLGLKGRPSYPLWSDYSGLGQYVTNGSNRYNSVLLPTAQYGPLSLAAQANFSMTDGNLVSNFQCSANFARTPGGFGAGDRVANFLRPVPLTAVASAGPPGGAANATLAATVEEDTGWSGRSVFQRRIITRVGGTPTDLNSVSVAWAYPN